MPHHPRLLASAVCGMLLLSPAVPSALAAGPTAPADASSAPSPDAPATPSSNALAARRAITVHTGDAPVLATASNGVRITDTGYGSALTHRPGDPDDVFLGMTDRGPNTDSEKSGEKIEPLTFQPAIGRFRLVGGRMILDKRIGLRTADGTPVNGAVNTEATTGETIVDLDGNPVAPSPAGLDPEGLVAAPDGTFWISDEYGPYVLHVDATGREISRLKPFDGSLPGELAMRTANRGMEGLTLTPDGRTLVGVMQSALETPDLKGGFKKVPFVRIVTIDVASRKVTGQYLYLLHLSEARTSVSEITAVGNHTLLVDERDGDAGPDTFKRLYRIDLSRATNILNPPPGTTYDASRGGLLVSGKSLEGLVSADKSAASNEDRAAEILSAHGITAAQGELALDMTRLVWTADPSGRTFPHDKIEGVAVTHGGRTITVSNDSDFGINGIVKGSHDPFQLVTKAFGLDTGRQDVGEALTVDMDALPASLRGPGDRTPTVTINDKGVAAHNLEPDTDYTVTIDGHRVGDLAADGSGRASLTWRKLATGKHTVTVSLNESALATSTITITGQNGRANPTASAPAGAHPTVRPARPGLPRTGV